MGYSQKIYNSAIYVAYEKCASRYLIIIRKKLVFIKGFQTKLDKVMSNIPFKFKPSPLMKSKQFQI